MRQKVQVVLRTVFVLVLFAGLLGDLIRHQAWFSVGTISVCVICLYRAWSRKVREVYQLQATVEDVRRQLSQAMGEVDQLSIVIQMHRSETNGQVTFQMGLAKAFYRRAQEAMARKDRASADAYDQARLLIVRRLLYLHWFGQVDLMHLMGVLGGLGEVDLGVYADVMREMLELPNSAGMPLPRNPRAREMWTDLLRIYDMHRRSSSLSESPS